MTDPAAGVPAVVVDLDGTLCDTRAVAYLVEGEERDFAAFHAASADAPADPEVLAAVRAAHDAGDAVLVVTSREFVWRDLTLDWLARHEVPYDRLEMRIVGDYRPDHVVKAEILERLLADGFAPHTAWEDRDDVADVWREHGLTVHLVG
ncbi:MAG: hypothetical protein PGN07_12410 [Aeromicrobium erythreum]